MPGCFEAYLKLFHAIYEDLSITDHTVSWDDAEGEQSLEDIAHEDKEIRKILGEGTLVRGEPTLPFRGRRITWEALAKRYCLRFHSEITDWSFTNRFPGRSWPRYLVGPAEGSLDKESYHALVEALRPFTGRQWCYFYYDVIATESYKGPLLFKGAIEEASLAPDLDEVHTTPTYWWPEERTWCVYTDWDMTFTLVAGTKEIVRVVSEVDALEVVPVSPTTRVDYKADEVNVKEGV